MLHEAVRSAEEALPCAQSLLPGFRSSPVQVITDPATLLTSLFRPDATHSVAIAGDSSTILGRFPDGVFQSCITSPPYFSLRGYQIPGQIGLEP